MQPITRKELLKEFENYIDEKINLKIEGNILLEIVLSKFNYKVENDIVELQDMSNKNNILFNFNNVNFMAKMENRIICTLNDQGDTIIEIERKKN